MKPYKELRTVIVDGVQLDVHYTVDRMYDEYTVDINYIEDINSTQDLTPIISESVFNYIQRELTRHENKYEPATIPN